MTKLENKIAHVLEETRVILPGTQALLGFQLIAIFSSGFEHLAKAAQYVHIASLFTVILSSIFLMASSSYHRIVEKGEDTERLHEFASAMLMVAMILLALGVSTDAAIVVYFVTGSLKLAIATAAVLVTLFYGVWIFYPLYKRRALGNNR